MNSYLGLIPLGLPEILFLALTIAWVWAIVDVATDKQRQTADKVVWILALVLFSLLATLVYWVLKLANRRHSPGNAG